MWTYNDSAPDIYHYGVLGMKWGVRKKRKKKGKTSFIARGRSYVKDLVEGFNKGVAAELASQQQQRQIQQGQQWLMDRLMQLNRQSGSLAISGGTNPYMFG